MNPLPREAREIAEAQGWDSESILIYLVSFIADNGLDSKLADYFAACAKDENAQLEES